MHAGGDRERYTAEEVGEAVGLSGGELFKAVSSVSEDVLKQSKVQFSDDYQVPSVFLQHGMRNDLEILSNRKKLQGGGLHQRLCQSGV